MLVAAAVAPDRGSALAVGGVRSPGASRTQELARVMLHDPGAVIKLRVSGGSAHPTGPTHRNPELARWLVQTRRARTATASD